MRGGIVLNGDLSNNGLNQIPRVTSLNSLSEALSFPSAPPKKDSQAEMTIDKSVYIMYTASV